MFQTNEQHAKTQWVCVSSQNNSNSNTLSVSIPLETTLRSSTCPNSPHPPPPCENYKHVCCQRTPPLNLPIPSPARRQPSESDSLDALSPIVGCHSPTNFTFNFTINLRSQEKGTPDSKTLELALLPKMQQLMETYQGELLKIEEHYENPDTRLDEMASLDNMWNELDRKIDSVRTTIKVMKRIV